MLVRRLTVGHLPLEQGIEVRILAHEPATEVLAAIRDGKADNPAECARVALTTQAIDFCRFYALNFEE